MVRVLAESSLRRFRKDTPSWLSPAVPCCFWSTQQDEELAWHSSELQSHRTPFKVMITPLEKGCSLADTGSMVTRHVSGQICEENHKNTMWENIWIQNVFLHQVWDFIDSSTKQPAHLAPTEEGPPGGGRPCGNVAGRTGGSPSQNQKERYRLPVHAGGMLRPSCPASAPHQSTPLGRTARAKQPKAAPCHQLGPVPQRTRRSHSSLWHSGPRPGEVQLSHDLAS